MATIIDSVSTLKVSREEVIAFLRKHWGKDIALTVNEFYDWQFVQNQSGDGSDSCILAMDSHSNRILGFLGVTERSFQLGNSDRHGAELTTWVVSPQDFGKGIGAKMLFEAQHRYEIMIAISISQMSLPVFLRCGFHYTRHIPRYTRVFNFDAVRQFAEFEVLAYKLAKQWGSAASLSYVATEIDANNLEKLKINSGSLDHFDRSAEKIAWRYLDHPVYRYHCFLVSSDTSDNAKPCLVCLRIELGVTGLRVLHVLDCLGDAASIPTALSFIDDFSRAHDVDIADFFCTSSSVLKHFRCGGWFSTLDHTFFRFPHLFHPVDLRNPPTTSLAYWSSGGCQDLADTANLYITKQDADMDKPTGQTYRALNLSSN